MSLRIKMAETETGWQLALCDKDGVPLPGQMSVQIMSQKDDVIKAVVEFAIGELVVISNGDLK